MASATHPLVIRPHPFSQDYSVQHVAARAGQTIRQMFESFMQGVEVSPLVRVELGGRDIPQSMWAKVRPKPGVALHITRMPAGDSGGKKWLRTILLIVVMVVAIVAAPYLAPYIGGNLALASAAVYMVGALRVAAFIPEKI